MSILEALNPAQRRAAAMIDGPLLVLAGAGSGKTRVLCYRIAHLVREVGVPPWKILALTFTNKAAGEMRQRLERLIGPAARPLWMGTFHAVCVRLLRLEAAALGLDPNFSIYDEDDRRALMRRLLKTLDIGAEELAPRALIARISRAKNAMIPPAIFADEAGESPHRRRIAQVYAAYEAELRRHNAFDFDDLIVEPVRRFRQHPEVLARYQERFQHLLIDEYQDTNRPQYLLSRQLAAGHRNICCVGDDDQSIYQFRGADLRNILDFERDYADARIVRLEQNYRSSGRILAAANALIRHNRSRKGKELWTEAPEGELVELRECDTDRGEARHIVHTLRRLCAEEGYAPHQAAVLYRTNAQSRLLEEELQRAALPYRIVGGVRFYERREIKDLLAYLRLLVNPADDLSLRRVINTPKRGIGGTSLEHLQAFARRERLGLFAALEQLDRIPELGARARRSMAAFAALLRELIAAAQTLELSELGDELYQRSGYRRLLEAEDSPEAEARRQNIAQLIADMTEFGQTREEPSLERFLEEKSLLSPGDELADATRTLTLMTLHSAKGLEYPLIFICGLEEKLFPTARALEEEEQNPQAIEEERRLFYVGITRAQQRLWLSYARRRFAYGALIETEPSRFLGEIPSHLLEVRMDTCRERDPSSRAPEGVHYAWDGMEAAGPIDEEEFLAVGRWVLHPSWGRGQIVGREGRGPHTRLSIRFAGRRIKRVLLAYAQLEPA